MSIQKTGAELEIDTHPAYNGRPSCGKSARKRALNDVVTNTLLNSKFPGSAVPWAGHASAARAQMMRSYIPLNIQ